MKYITLFSSTILFFICVAALLGAYIGSKDESFDFGYKDRVVLTGIAITALAQVFNTINVL